MATITPTSGSKPTETSSSSKKVDFTKYTPQRVELESATGDVATARIWTKIYESVGASGEDARLSVRCAVYVYAALNGTSSVGNYKAKVKTSEGKLFDASIIIKAAGTDVRKFLRANMMEAYRFFKETGVMETYETFVVKAEAMGISPADCFVMADFFANCPYFTPLEAKSHVIAQNYALARASTARAGKTLSEIAAEGRAENLDAQAASGIRSHGSVPWT